MPSVKNLNNLPHYAISFETHKVDDHCINSGFLQDFITGLIYFVI